jgi:hypothetical protein
VFYFGGCVEVRRVHAPIQALCFLPNYTITHAPIQALCFLPPLRACAEPHALTAAEGEGEGEGEGVGEREAEGAGGARLLVAARGDR